MPKFYDTGFASVLLLLLLLIGVGVGVYIIRKPTNFLPQAQETPKVYDFRNLRDNLESKGFKIGYGKLYFFKASDCAKIFDQTQTCFNNNPLSPYGLYLLPASPDEKRDPQRSRLDLDDFIDEHNSLDDHWKLAPNEAVVFIGKTPPKVKYFSFLSYIYSRASNFSDSRDIVFGSLHEALNNKKIKTTSLVGSDDVFQKQVIIISTASENTFNKVSQILVASGINPSVINQDILPSKLPLNMGTSPTADEFSELFRIALPQNPQDLQTYLDNPEATVLRLTPQTASNNDAFFKTPNYPSRTTGTKESDNFPGIEADLAKLQSQVEAKFAKNYQIEKSDPAPAKGLVGQTCIKYRINCLADNWDTTYTNSNFQNSLFESSGSAKLSFFMALGVNHIATGKSSYQNIAVNDKNRQLGVVSLADDSFSGSASLYSPDLKYPDKLFAIKIARDQTCDQEEDAQSSQFCLRVPQNSPDNLAIPPNQPVSLIIRNYLNPQTNVAPEYDEITYPIFLHFTPK